MQKKGYKVLLEKNIIGTTELEGSDAPMGVVFGVINLMPLVMDMNFGRAIV